MVKVVAASYEFDRRHNAEVVERPTDNVAVPQLMKSLSLLGDKKKEKFPPYSVKARSLIFAHLSRIPLDPNTLNQDRYD